jgi:hypothetical protein
MWWDKQQYFYFCCMQSCLLLLEEFCYKVWVWRMGEYNTHLTPTLTQISYRGEWSTPRSVEGGWVYKRIPSYLRQSFRTLLKGSSSVKFGILYYCIEFYPKLIESYKSQRKGRPPLAIYYSSLVYLVTLSIDITDNDIFMPVMLAELLFFSHSLKCLSMKMKNYRYKLITIYPRLEMGMSSIEHLNLDILSKVC